MKYSAWYIEEESHYSAGRHEWIRTCTPEFEDRTRQAFDRLQKEEPHIKFRIVKKTIEIFE